MLCKTKKDKDKLLRKHSLTDDGSYNEQERVSLELRTGPKEDHNINPLDKTDYYNKELNSVTTRKKDRRLLFGWTHNRRAEDETTDHNISSCSPSSSSSLVVDLSLPSSSVTLLRKKAKFTKRDEVNATKEVTALEKAKKTMALVANNVAVTAFLNASDNKEKMKKYGEGDKGLVEPKGNGDDEKRDLKHETDNKEKRKNDSDKQQGKKDNRVEFSCIWIIIKITTTC